MNSDSLETFQHRATKGPRYLEQHSCPMHTALSDYTYIILSGSGTEESFTARPLTLVLIDAHATVRLKTLYKNLDESMPETT